MWPDWLTFKALGGWPGPLTPDHQRRHSPFKATLSKTVTLLEKELRALNTIDGTDILQVALQPTDIRLDGKPRATARPAHPGVILSFSMRPQSKAFGSKRQALGYIAEIAQEPDFPYEDGDTDWLYKRAVMHAHPDKGGDRKVWDRLTEAHRVLSADESYQFAVDTFRTWDDNLRAIALGLEALRKVERYGITKGTEQYTGWKQLTA